MVKEWLKQGRKLKFEIDALKEAKKNVFDLATGGANNYGSEKVQSGSENSTEKLYAKYSEYSAELDKKIKELEKHRFDMLSVISAIPDTAGGNDGTIFRAILTEYYINCKSWEDIAEQLHYSERMLYRKHIIALEQVGIIYKYLKL